MYIFKNLKENVFKEFSEDMNDVYEFIGGEFLEK